METNPFENNDAHSHDATSTAAATSSPMNDLDSDSAVSSPAPTPDSLDGAVSTGTSASISPWITPSDRRFGHGSPTDASDRVFPIRSVVSYELARRASGDLVRTGTTLSESSSTASSMTRHASSRSDADMSRQTASPALETTPSTLSQITSSSSNRARQQHPYTSTGIVSSIQADADRRGSTKPIDLHLDEHYEGSEPPSGSGDMDSRPAGPSTGQSAETFLSEDLYAWRFKHVMTGEGHAVITGRDGTLQRCEDEPIRTPGSIQGFGLMITLHEEPDGRFLVQHVSENSMRLIGYSPQELFSLSNFLDILTEEQADNLLDHIDFIRDEDADPAVNGPEVFSISIRPPGKRHVKLWCAIHIPQTQPDLIICEFELDDDPDYPLRPPDESISDMPEDTLQGNPTLEELTESTEIMSKPLRVLRSARKRRGEAGAIQVFDIMGQVQEQLASAPNLEIFLKILVGIVKELTGFHRILVYQFDASFNGKVVTELVDPAQTRDLYKGLNFPASDIPRQARDLYKLNKVRLLYDRALETARIVCRSTDDLKTPLDMSHSYLRAMSPIHLRYLGNMAVRSSMSISINAFNELWGLIACHSYGPKGMRVSFPIRKMCRLVGDNVSRNIERLSYASRLQAHKLINTVPTDKNPSGYIVASSEDLLKLFDASFGMLSIHDETKILGKLEQSQEALVLLEYLRLLRLTTVVTSQDITEDFPELRYPPGFSVVAGLLYVPLSAGGNDFIVFFRKGQAKEVKWAGNPYEKIIREGTAEYLEPRTSFRVWHETVVGKCRKWSEEQVETAAVLCLVYGKFIEVWRQKEAVLQNSRLRRLLLANSAHEVRTPLNAIINYLEIALESPLDQETRDNLAKSHSASKSLIYVINDLLDLTKTEEGQGLIKDEAFELSVCIREATEPFMIDAKRKGIAYEVIDHPGLPSYVVGDQRRVRQAVANVTANAVQYTAVGSVRVETYVSEVQDRRVRVEIAVEDTGKGMSNIQLDNMFRELEQVSPDVDDDLGSAVGKGQDDEKPKAGKTLGLGLAVVARIVRTMDGQLRLKSEEGKGSRFVIQLAFELPPDDVPGMSDRGGDKTVASAAASSTAMAPSVATTRHQSQEGEVMLIGRGPSITPKRSFETSSVTSHHSTHSTSSAKSDADRLIDAIQSPLALGESEWDLTTRQRSNSSRATPFSVAAGASAKNIATKPGSPREKKNPRPGILTRSLSYPDGRQFTESADAARIIGMALVTDSRTPIKPVKVPDEFTDLPGQPEQPEQPEQLAPQSQPQQSSRVLPEIPENDKHKPDLAVTTAPAAAGSARPLPDKLKVLVAEDDPINVKILRKRLEKAGHEVFHAVNGEDCASLHKEKPDAFDAILMDMQMPIVDGLASTKMIRALEQSDKNTGLSAVAEKNGRIPIFAVSASLVEQDKETYVAAGFDGWILKPIDFKRLETLLKGIIDDKVRNELVYSPGHWECGGWFGPGESRA